MEEFFLARGAQLLKRKCTGLLSTTSRKWNVKGSRKSRKIKETKRLADEVNGEVEEVTQRAHETLRIDDGVNETQT